VGRDLAFSGRAVVDAAGSIAGSLGHSERDRAAVTEATRQMPHGNARLVAMGETHDLLIEPVTGEAAHRDLRRRPRRAGDRAAGAACSTST
jgi:hypothetical protein